MNTNLITYYQERAAEYERIYHKPERQLDLAKAATILQTLFKEKEIIEIACGTGYWTAHLAKTAASIEATDINEAVIDIAKQKDFAKAKVEFSVADIYNFKPINPYESLFGGFIWSHIPLQDLNLFLETVHQFVLPKGLVCFIDNRYVEGSNLPINHYDNLGNSFQIRELENKTTHKVLKNFPSKAFLHETLSTYATAIQVIELEYFWILSYRKK